MTHGSVPFGFLRGIPMVLVLVGGCSGKGRAPGSPTMDAALGGATGSGGVSIGATSSASGGSVSIDAGRTGTGGNTGYGGASDTQGTGGLDNRGGAHGGAGGGSTDTSGRGSGGASSPRDAGGVSGTGGRDADTSDGPIQCEYQGKLFAEGESVGLGCNSCTCDASSKMFVCISTGCGLGGGSSTDGGPSGECGDPALKALFPSCKASTDAASCSERGGLWRARNNTGTCVCPTGEGGCPCTASADCLGDCIAWKEPFGGCAKEGPFTCTAFGSLIGCWCRPEEPLAVCYP